MSESFYLRAGKPALDACLSAVGIILISPVLLVAAVAVKLTSRGPALFRQIRVGRDGKPFWIYKFRTMVADADKGSPLTASGDPRITAVGAFLRKTKIDELPQLFNVFRGDMSLVGPRPEVPAYTAGYTERQKLVFRAKPGITGPSINVYEEELLARQFDKEMFYLKTILPAKLEVDIEYSENVSFRGDLKLILATFSKIFIRLRDLLRVRKRTSRSTSPTAALQNLVRQGRSDHRPGKGPRTMKPFDLYSRTNQMILDGSAFAISLLSAYLIRFDGWPSGLERKQMLLWLPLLVAARLGVHWTRGIYRKIWRFVSFSDALDIVQSLAIVSGALVALRLLYPAQAPLGPWVRLPLSVIAFEGLASLSLTLGFRAVRRALYARERRKARASGETSKRVLLYGAGRAGIMIRRELENGRAYDAVGFVDDDPRKFGTMVARTRVIGSGDDLAELVSRYFVDEVLVCMATAPGEALRRVVAKCESSGAAVRIIPSVNELLSGVAPTSPDRSELQTAAQAVEEARISVRANPGPLERVKDRQILVVGGGGYIGSTMVRQLLSRNYRVRVLDNLTYGDGGIRELLSRPDFELITGDSRDVEVVVRACRDIGAVIHLGAIVGDAACALDPSRSVEINLAATKMIVEICKGYGVSRFLFASTCSVYGESAGIVNEESPTNPISLYASTKLDSESIITSAASGDFHPTVLRLATAFGSSYRLRFDLVVNLLSIKALTERKITVHGGRQWRPFIHVDDIASAFILCLESPLEKVSAQIFNGGSDELNFTIAELARIISECVPNVKIEHTPGIDQRDYHVSFAKIRQRLGFACRKGIEDAVLEFKQLFEAKLISDYRDRRYSNHEFLKAEPGDSPVYAAARSLPVQATLRSLSSLQGFLGQSPSAAPDHRASLNA